MDHFVNKTGVFTKQILRTDGFSLLKEVHTENCLFLSFAELLSKHELCMNNRNIGVAKRLKIWASNFRRIMTAT